MVMLVAVYERARNVFCEYFSYTFQVTVFEMNVYMIHMRKHQNVKSAHFECIYCAIQVREQRPSLYVNRNFDEDRTYG